MHLFSFCFTDSDLNTVTYVIFFNHYCFIISLIFYFIYIYILLKNIYILYFSICDTFFTFYYRQHEKQKGSERNIKEISGRGEDERSIGRIQGDSWQRSKGKCTLSCESLLYPTSHSAKTYQWRYHWHRPRVFHFYWSNSLKGLSVLYRGRLAIGRTGTIPGGLAANLARYPTFFCCCFLPNI